MRKHVPGHWFSNDRYGSVAGPASTLLGRPREAPKARPPPCIFFARQGSGPRVTAESHVPPDRSTLQLSSASFGPHRTRYLPWTERWVETVRPFAERASLLRRPPHGPPRFPVLCGCPCLKMVCGADHAEEVFACLLVSCPRFSAGRAVVRLRVFRPWVYRPGSCPWSRVALSFVPVAACPLCSVIPSCVVPVAVAFFGVANATRRPSPTVSLLPRPRLKRRPGRALFSP